MDKKQEINYEIQSIMEKHGVFCPNGFEDEHKFVFLEEQDFYDTCNELVEFFIKEAKKWN